MECEIRAEVSIALRRWARRVDGVGWVGEGREVSSRGSLVPYLERRVESLGLGVLVEAWVAAAGGSVEGCSDLELEVVLCFLVVLLD